MTQYNTILKLVIDEVMVSLGAHNQHVKVDDMSMSYNSILYLSPFLGSLHTIHHHRDNPRSKYCCPPNLSSSLDGRISCRQTSPVGKPSQRAACVGSWHVIQACQLWSCTG